jgi:hypothetical protein
MMALSATQLMAAATEVLVENGYRRIETPKEWPAASRLFEDEYGIVTLRVYDTWQRLRDEWNVAQGELVDLMSSRLGRPDPKSWEGYLVLLTVANAPEAQRREVVDLRYNTNRLRKLVATGLELETVDDVHTALLPLLPLNLEPPSTSGAGLLDRLPDLLAEDGIDPVVTETAVSSFLHNESIMEGLHELGPGP